MPLMKSRCLLALAALGLMTSAAWAQGQPQQPQPNPAALTYELGINAGMALAGAQARNAMLTEWLAQAQAERDYWMRYAGVAVAEPQAAPAVDKPPARPR